MRKTLIATLAAVAAISLSAGAASARPSSQAAAAEVGTGAVVGTVAGVGLYNGWFGSEIAATAGPAVTGTVVGSATVGGVVGVGAVAVVDSVVEPCQGFQALFGMNQGACANGEYVGYAPQRARRVR